MPSIVLTSLFLTAAASTWHPNRLDTSNKTVLCACVVRDTLAEFQSRMKETNFATLSTSTTTSATTDIKAAEEQIRTFTPYKFWNMYKKGIQKTKENLESYMGRYLSLFQQKLQTTAVPTLVQDDLPAKSQYANYGKAFLRRYFSKLKTQWDLLDRLVCSCDGDLLAVLKAETYITMQLAHD